MTSRKEADGPAQGGDVPTWRRWRTAFLAALAALLLSLLALVVVLATALASDDEPSATPGGDVAPATTTATAAEPESTPTPAQPKPSPSPGTPVSPTPTPASGYAENPVTCGDILAPLDKQHILGPNCAPGDLVALPGSASAGGQQLMRSESAAALLEMIGAAAREGLVLYALSSYRSYQDQVDTYNYWVRTIGQAQADRTSARPGHSEHQLGTTTDLTSDSAGRTLEGFAGTREAAWVAANSWKYGFIVSYPEGKEDITGYDFEPWHVRYLGKDTARRAHDSGVTLHEFLLRR